MEACDRRAVASKRGLVMRLWPVAVIDFALGLDALFVGAFNLSNGSRGFATADFTLGGLMIIVASFITAAAIRARKGEP